MNRASIYTIPTNEPPEWAEGVPCFGWVYATRHDLPLPPDESSAQARHVILCAPGTEPPKNVVLVIVKGHVTPWTPETIATAWPNGSRYVLESTWPASPRWPRLDVPSVERGKMIELPAGATPIETAIVPRVWAGDGR